VPVEEASGFQLSGDVPAMEVARDVIRNGGVNSEAIAALERAGVPEPIGAAYFLAGKHEYEHGDRERARYYLERASHHLPKSTVVLNHYAAVLIQLERAREAISVAERSIRLAPSDADGWFVLGYAYYVSNRTGDAITAWKRGLGLRPEPGVQRLLAKAEREASTESGFQQSETGHFVLRYEGASTSPLLREQVEQALEEVYNELVTELGIAPGNVIPVALYNNRAFFDVTQAPSWIGALNDGKFLHQPGGARALSAVAQ
jgi:tetratricopeptide (TPR) repeat protein